jgi:hypothetical protein
MSAKSRQPSKATPPTPEPESEQAAAPRSNAAAQERMARPAGSNNPWIPDFIEDWLWGKEEAAPAAAAKAAAPKTDTTWWDRYKAEASATKREEMVRTETTASRMQARFDALSRDQRLGAYKDAIQEALDFYQLHATLNSAGKTQAQLGKSQADHMAAEEKRLATKSSPKKAPTQKELDEARKQLDKQDYVVEPEADALVWPNLSVAEQARWVARGNAARAKLCAHINAKHPQYKITIEQLVVDFAEVERLGAVAYNQGDDRCTFGFTVVEATEMDPEFAVSTVVHELFGHNEFDRGFSVSERLFREAVAQRRGVKPEDVVLTDDEWSRFVYFETEIASLVWEYDLYVGKNARGQRNPLGSPGELMVSLMRNLQSQWAPDLAGPLLTGLHRRFQADPAVSDAAAEFFRKSAETELGLSLK